MYETFNNFQTKTFKLYHTVNNNQAKFTDSQENMATTHKRVTKQPVYNDIVAVQEKEIEAFLTNNACNKRLAIINLTLNKIKFKGYWRASHSYIAELLNVSSDYVQETLSRSMSLGIIRSKRTFNGSSIYTYNSEFTKSSIIDRLRPYFPGMRSLLSLLSLLSSLPNCTYADSIHAEGRETRTDILLDLRSLSNSYNYNINPQGNGLIGVNLKTVNEENRTKPQEETQALSKSFEDYARVAIRNNSLIKPPVALPPQISQAELMRKRSQAFMDAEKKEQQRYCMSSKGKYVFLSDYGRALSVLMGINEWDAALLASISAEDIKAFLFEASTVLHDSKIASKQSIRFLKKKEKDRVIHTNVICNVGNFVWSMLRKRFILDYSLASTVRHHYNLDPQEKMTMQQQALWISSLKKIMNELEFSYNTKVKERVNNKKTTEIQQQQEYKRKALKEAQDRDKIREQHAELVRQEDFAEDDYDDDFTEDGLTKGFDGRLEENPYQAIHQQEKQLTQVKQSKPPKETIISNNPAPLGATLTPQEQCDHDIAKYRESLSKMPPFMYTMMKANFTKTLIDTYALPSDFTII